MDELAKYIEERLAGRKCCIVFREALARAFPFLQPRPDRRIEEIHAFAKAHGWTATIFDPGIRVTFTKCLDDPKKRSLANKNGAAPRPARTAPMASVAGR
jgi:hypothetical protein